MYRNLCFQNINDEIWKPVIGYEGYYEISNLGRVKSIAGKKYCKNSRSYNMPKKILKQSVTTTGYLKVKMLGKDYKVHRLVAEAFIPKIKGKDIINHKDCNPFNNKIGNLEWCTQKENIRHALLNQRKSAVNYNIHQHEYDVINYYTSGETAKTIASRFNVSIFIIRNILSKHKINRCGFRNYTTKYNINLNNLIIDFSNNISNRDLSKKYNCPSNLIARRRYQFKKGEIKQCKNG